MPFEVGVQALGVNLLEMPILPFNGMKEKRAMPKEVLCDPPRKTRLCV